jgi:2-dehydro-3-deoxygluconokinase
MSERFGCKTLVLTLGENGAMAIENKGDVVHAPQTFRLNQIVDRIGAGDAFDAGFIAAKLWKMSLGDALNYGNALSAMKMTMPGDVALVKKVEVDSLVRGASNPSAR